MNKRTNIKDFARRAAMAVLLALVTSTQAWAQGSVSYRAYNALTHQFEDGVAASPTAVSEETTTMSDGWYVVSGNVNVSGRIEVTDIVNLILCDGATLTATQGLHVPTGVTLNIYGQSDGSGGLTATQGGSDQAGIGGNNGEVSGTITIHGGNVTSTGGWSGAGIGGGHNQPCGSITIYGGTVNAHGGNRAAGIGGGTGEYSGGSITIKGGSVTARANTYSGYDNSQAIGVGQGNNAGTCTLNIDYMKVYDSADATTPVVSTDRENTCQSKYVRLTTCDHHYVNNECTYCGADENYAPRQYLAYETASHSFMLRSAYEFTYVTSSTTTMGTAGSETYYVVKNSVTVSSRIQIRGTVHLILCDDKTLTASSGITVNSGNTLNIYGQTAGTGALNATGVKLGGDGTEAAAIGSTARTTVGNISIHGGRINADGAPWSAGIGGGVSAGGGSVKIYGGTVDATGHNGISEAIGRGSSGSSVSKTIADGLCVIVDGNMVAYNNRVSSLNSSQYDLRDTRQATVRPCNQHNFSGNTCKYCGIKKYSVTYNGNNSTSGTVPTDANIYYGNGVSYSEGATFTIRGNTTLYAMWMPLLELAANADNSNAISAAAANGKQHRVVLDGYTLYRDGTWNTLVLPFNLANFSGTPLEGLSVKTLESSTLINGELTLNFANANNIEAGKPYIVKDDNADLVIRTTDDWNAFANSMGTESYEGKTVVLDTDVTADYRVGVYQRFKGTFDGCGHTLTFNKTWYDQDDIAPFCQAENATFRNLRIVGTINTSGKFAAGLVALSYGDCTIENCQCSIVINSSIDGDGTHGGFIGVCNTGSGTNTVSFVNCLFDGTISGSNTTSCGGFVGWRNATIKFTNCLMAGGMSINQTSSSAIFNRNGGSTFTNSYYKGSFGSVTTQGSDASSMSASDLATALGSAWQVSGNNVVPKMITIIENPVFEGVTLSAATANVETTYSEFIGSYAPITGDGLLLDANNPNGDGMHAAIRAKLEGYSVSYYTKPDINFPATTIPFSADGNVTLWTICVPTNYSITYNLDGGTNHAGNPATYNIESTTITLQAPTKIGYTFGGWFDNEDCAGNAVTTIATGSHGNVTLYAKWLTDNLELTVNGDNSSAISSAAASGKYHNVTLADCTIYRDGDWNTLVLPFNLATLTDTPLEGLTVKTLESTTFSNGMMTMNFSDNLTSIEAGKPYIVKDDNADLVIRTAADWNTFAQNVTNGTNNYQGKLVKLAADISVTTMAGTSGRFKGTFDGCGHKLTVNLTNVGTYGAPFQYIDGATIRNLHTAGTISGTDILEGGIAGRTYGTTRIENCRSSVSLTTTKGDNGAMGGIVGVAESGSLIVVNCLFDGSLLGSSNTNCAGIVNWRRNSASINISNSLFAPSEVTVSTTGAYTITRPVSVTNCYYTQSLGTVQGTDAAGMSNETLVSNLGTGWEIRDGNVVPKMADNIVNPVFSNVLISDTAANVSTDHADFIGSYAPITDDGLLLDAHNPNGDAMHAALSIDEPTRDGYTFGGWYTDAGLTTPLSTIIPFATNGNVTFYGKWTPHTYNVRFNKNHEDASGTMDDQPFTYGTEQALTANVFTAPTGYMFAGWSTTTNGEVEYIDGQSVSNLATEQDAVVNLYAQWSEYCTLFAEGSTNQWMTWCDDDEWSVAAAPVKVYTVSGISGSTVTLTEENSGRIPANTPLLIQRTDNGTSAITVPLRTKGTTASTLFAAAATDCTFYGNPTDLAITTDDYFTADQSYVLYGDKFLLVDTDEGIAPHRCLLTLSSPAGARRLDIIFDDDSLPNKVLSVKSEEKANVWYTIDGRKLWRQPARKGIYINNGKKTVIKQ